MTRAIDYGNLMHTAMRGLIRTVLSDVAERGLPGEHHFFITIDTMNPDVEIADWLSDRYPEKMTIVIQHEFEGLEVGDDGFSVTLFFGGQAVPLYIPWDAILTFYDPSVNLALRFEAGEEDDEAEDDEDAAETGPKEEGDAEIVSLDSFRK